MGEIDFARKDVELIKHSGRKKDTFTRVIRRIGSELAFGEFEHGVSLVDQIKRPPNFLENADSVVVDRHRRGSGRLSQRDENVAGA